MRLFNSLFVLIGTLFAAGGYGATFFLSMHFNSLGGSDIDTGLALAEATLGTLVGVLLVGWFAQRIGAARTMALAALCIGAGVTGFALIERISPFSFFPGFLVGLGWGAFCLAAPMSLAERTSDAERGAWFMRFGTVQMAGIGGCPAVAAFAIHSLRWPLTSVLLVIGGLCGVAALLLETFGRISPRSSALPASPVQERWLREFGAISRTRAAYPIVMISLCACVFSGLMTFQMSLVQGTGLQAGTFFSVYAVTVVAARWLLARVVIRLHREVATKVLLVMMLLGVAAVSAVPYNAMFHPASAILLGTGYGLVYPTIQTQAVNDSAEMHRPAALTWFVVAYFIGTFGFPAIGGWVLVHMGRDALVALIAACGLAALMLAIMQDRRGVKALSKA
ncbi:Major Facilitator Superfamily protein [Paraburkholderia fungorum]|uniref:Major Facilitator Superfamily protein n=1 Tax=Paraburkholderia fungorum TaxID=134537 RepID=A0A1H1JI53_9BURK|nr:MFS transporter [Paraburkholderia fungorum]SDR49602.1 Major Facilitator Superfamily protein [Paraburkholderia fungorum]